MNPETHLLASWVIGAKATQNPRDCRIVALAGILPDADGLGLILDGLAALLGWRKTLFYEHYHHFLLHGIFGAVLITALLLPFARQRIRVGLLCLIVCHLHIVCDLIGSRGPSPLDLWPVFYLGPFDKDPMWLWKGQWRLDAWPNRLLSVGLFAWSIWLAPRLGYSFVGVFSKKLDEVVIPVLQKWHAQLAATWSTKTRTPIPS